MRLSPDRPMGLAPATVSDYRELARRRLPRSLFDYIDGGAYDEASMAANVDELRQVLLRQRVLRDVTRRDQATTVQIDTVDSQNGTPAAAAARAASTSARGANMPQRPTGPRITGMADD